MKRIWQLFAVCVALYGGLGASLARADQAVVAILYRSENSREFGSGWYLFKMQVSDQLRSRCESYVASGRRYFPLCGEKPEYCGRYNSRTCSLPTRTYLVFDDQPPGNRVEKFWVQSCGHRVLATRVNVTGTLLDHCRERVGQEYRQEYEEAGYEYRQEERGYPTLPDTDYSSYPSGRVLYPRVPDAYYSRPVGVEVWSRPRDVLEDERRRWYPREEIRYSRPERRDDRNYDSRDAYRDVQAPDSYSRFTRSREGRVTGRYSNQAGDPFPNSRSSNPRQASAPARAAQPDRPSLPPSRAAGAWPQGGSLPPGRQADSSSTNRGRGRTQP